MIHDTSRKFWIGASDTHKYIMNDNHATKTWQTWWQIKIGLIESDFVNNMYTLAGNNYEHSILKSINKDMSLDDQHIIEDLLLRVNYDGIYEDTIYEVKTHKADAKDWESKCKKGGEYWEQVQVQMYCYKETTGKEPKAYIVEYSLYPEDYMVDIDPEVAEKGEVPISEKRIKKHEVDYDKKWVEKKYLPRLKELAEKLREETDGKGIT